MRATTYFFFPGNTPAPPLYVIRSSTGSFYAGRRNGRPFWVERQDLARRFQSLEEAGQHPCHSPGFSEVVPV